MHAACAAAWARQALSLLALLDACGMRGRMGLASTSFQTAAISRSLRENCRTQLTCFTSTRVQTLTHTRRLLTGKHYFPDGSYLEITFVDGCPEGTGLSLRPHTLVA